MKKVLIIISVILLITITSLFGYIIYKDNNSFSIKTIKFLEYNAEAKEIKISIEKNEQSFFNNFTCHAKSENHEFQVDGKDNTCIIALPTHEDYEIYLENEHAKTSSLSLADYIENNLNFSFDEEEIYLIVGEDYTFSYHDEYAFEKPNYIFISSNESVAKVENNTIKALKSGETSISIAGVAESLKVIVTDLVHMPVFEGQNKPRLTCHAYTEEEAMLLDKLLAFQISKAGDKTRAGAVAAARFLTLELPYRVPYFYENGRLEPKTAVHIVDGEGRYYKKGLYLSDNKFESITSTWKGPAIWGCPLMNLEEDEESGYYPGQMRGNGLDCSGFVSWTLVNGGFDPGDVGAGENEGIYQLTDTGEWTKLTKELINSGKIKVGDLFNYWGHISILIGMDNDYFYIAESLQYHWFDGATVKKYAKSNVTNTFDYVVLMDSFYKEDGNLTDMWWYYDNWKSCFIF